MCNVLHKAAEWLKMMSSFQFWLDFNVLWLKKMLVKRTYG